MIFVIASLFYKRPTNDLFLFCHQQRKPERKRNIVTKKKIKTNNYKFVDYERERKREIVIINK